MKNEIVEKISRYITNEYGRINDTKLEFGGVLNKFEHLLSNDLACSFNEGILVKLFSNISLNESELNYFVEDVLYGKVNEGFYNPFDTDEYIDDRDIKDIRVDDNAVVKDRDNCPIRKIRRWDTNVNGKIYCKGKNKMYSGIRFLPGDIVEECPIHIVRSDAMHSRDLRDLLFQVYPEKEIYGIPMGYANCYPLSGEIGENPNIDYEYYPEEGIIRFIAIDNIKPNSLLVLRSEENFIK